MKPDVDVFQDQGYLVFDGLYSPSEVDSILEDLGRLVAGIESRFEPQPRKRGSYAMQYEESIKTTLKWNGATNRLGGLEPFQHLSVPLAEVGRDRRLTQACAAVLGVPDVSLYTEKVNLKSARGGEEITLHQDYPYWADCCVDAAQVVTAILFLDDASEANGCLRVLPGSHRVASWPTLPDVGDGMSACELDPAAVDRSELVPIEAHAGSVLVFGSLLVHGSDANLSNAHRRALLYSYQPAGRPRLTELLDPSWYN